MVAASCIIFYLLATNVSLLPVGKMEMLALLAFLACIEKLCSIMNMVAVEKDWVRVFTFIFSVSCCMHASRNNRN